ncbi:putative helicase CHR10 [Cardamine amara subsp. amara]|uniref:Helicase CHR10 n=1 Tax=Cardamine amara subsp. amara TaxID=228776 RepID=A0ABD1A1L7_CARAN
MYYRSLKCVFVHLRLFCEGHRKKLQLSNNVLGDNAEDKEEGRGDLRSLVFGLQRFDPEEVEIQDEDSDNLKMVEISSLAEKVVAIRQNVEPDKEERKFEINTSDNTSSSCKYKPRAR